MREITAAALCLSAHFTTCADRRSSGSHISVEQLLAGVTRCCVQEKAHEYLLLAPAECKAQVVAHRPRRRQRVPRGEFSSAARQFEGRPELSELGPPHTGVSARFVDPASSSPPTEPKRPSSWRASRRALPLTPVRSKIASQLGVGERGGASASSRSEDAPAGASR